MRPVIQALSRGSVFRRVTAIVLYGSAVVTGIFGLDSWIRVWGVKLEGAPPISFFGVIVFQLLFAIGIYAVVHATFIRARNVLELPEGEFTITPIWSLLTKLTGEVIAVYIAVIGVGGGILIWFLGPKVLEVLLIWLLGPQAQELLPFFDFDLPIPMGELFMVGMALMVSGLLLAYTSLVFFYWLSELVLVLVAIARNTEVTRRVAERYERAELPVAHGLHPSPRAGS